MAPVPPPPTHSGKNNKFVPLGKIKNNNLTSFQFVCFIPCQYKKKM